LTKIILEKIIKRIMWKNTVAIHSVLKKKNYKAKFLISSILKTIKSTEIISKKKYNKNKIQNK
jgi:hypothetical protein